MGNLNKAMLIGHLGRDPEITNLTGGTIKATLSLGTTEHWTDKNTQQKTEQTTWHRVVYFGATAEVIKKHLRKGAEVYVEGSIQHRKWQDKETGQDRYSSEIKGDRMQMLGGKKPADTPGEGQQGPDKYNDGVDV